MKLVAAVGHATVQVVRDLGITPNLLRRWNLEVAGDPVAAFPGRDRLTQELATATLTMALAPTTRARRGASLAQDR